MATQDNRLKQLLEQSRVTGLDFIYVHPNQVTLDIHFLRPPESLDTPLTETLSPESVHIYSAFTEAPPVKIKSLLWINVGDKSALRLTVEEPGSFTLYKLYIEDEKIDPFYNNLAFNFKANCRSGLDCKTPEHECPVEEPVDFPIDYLARDFWSFRRALLDFASQRYPGWPDRLEADAGIMLAEVMSSLGDEMSYYQDRVSREAYLETATERRSIRHHARLVDYAVHNGSAASTWLDVAVKEGSGNNNFFSAEIPANVWAIGDNGERIDFETGNLSSQAFYVNFNRNEFKPHLWDINQLCLAAGSTEFFLQGHVEEILRPPPGSAHPPVEWLLLKTIPANPAQQARVHLVRLTGVNNTVDPVFNQDITHISWEEAQALPFEMDLTVLTVRANILPVTAGKTYSVYFITGANLGELTPGEQTSLQTMAAQTTEGFVSRAIEREGHDGTLLYLFTLPRSESQPLVWLGDDPHQSIPEICLTEMQYEGDSWIDKKEWDWRPSLIGTYSADSNTPDYTIEDGSWRRVAGYQYKGEEFVHQDYASGNGTTIRFGDNEFGMIPAERSVFRVEYRLGGGRAGNVPAESLRYFDFEELNFIGSISNPFPASNGLDPELPGEVRQLAPEAFRAVTFRAVRPEDYAEAAERLPWVQRSGAVFRWTGSWLTAFVTPDPLHKAILAEDNRKDLEKQLNRFRQAGREAHVLDPIYADLDIRIDVCASSGAYRGEVKARVLEKLLGKKGALSIPGYFSADNFTFGTSLERSIMEAAIQLIPGVRAVEGIRFRRRGWFGWRRFNEMQYNPGKEAIIRVENNPLHPERGTLKIKIHGGA